MSDLTKLVADVRIDAAKVTWPDPVEVRTRGDRRTVRRRIAAAAVAAAVVLVVAGIFAPGAGPAHPVPAGPGVTTRLSLDSITAAPSGTVFAITHDVCVNECAGVRDSDQYTLRRSTDLARTWTTVGSVPGILGGVHAGPYLVVASDQVMWLEDGTSMMGSGDGGKHWDRWELGEDPTHSEGGGLVGTTLWTVFNGQVVTGTGGGQLTPTVGQPPGSGSLDSLAAISVDRAIVLRSEGEQRGWYRTADRGATWTPASDPCAELSHPNIGDAKMGAGREGGLWTICFVAGGAAPGWQIATSDDEGYTWQPHPGGAPGGDDISPVSATVAWRTGSQSDVYRTTDAGAHWTDVAHLPAGATLHGGFVVDANTALYVESESGDPSPTLHRTTDGGRTWTTVAFGL